jgi:hypothetical protein
MLLDLFSTRVFPGHPPLALLYGTGRLGGQLAGKALVPGSVNTGAQVVRRMRMIDELGH